MNLNTYRCGCGRIETLPHAKARPGACTHASREGTAWRIFEGPMPPGYRIEHAEKANGQPIWLKLALVYDD